MLFLSTEKAVVVFCIQLSRMLFFCFKRTSYTYRMKDKLGLSALCSCSQGKKFRWQRECNHNAVSEPRNMTGQLTRPEFHQSSVV